MGIGNLNVGVTANTTKARKNIGGLGKDVRGLGASSSISARGIKGLAVGFGIATAAGLALMRVVSAANDRVDDLAKTSKRLGITTENLAGLRLAAEETGVAQAKLDNSVQRMTRNISEAATGTGEASSAIKELGLDVNRLHTLAPDKQFREIAAAMGGVENHADKMRLAYKLFGREGVALVNTLYLGVAGLDEAQAAAERLGIAVSAVDAAKIEEANDAWGRMGKAAEGAGNSIAIAIAPAVESTANVLGKLITDLTSDLSYEAQVAREAAAAIAEKEAADLAAANAAAAKQEAERKLNETYKDQIKVLRQQRAEAAGGDSKQFIDEEAKYGRGKALALRGERQQLEVAEARAATEEKIRDLKLQVSEVGLTAAQKQANALMRAAPDTSQREEIRKQSDLLAAAEAKKAADAKAEAKRNESIEQERQKLAQIERTTLEKILPKQDAARLKFLSGIESTEGRLKANALFDYIDDIEKHKQEGQARAEVAGRANPGALDARSAEGFAALRTSQRQGVQAKILEENRKQLKAATDGNAMLAELVKNKQEIYSMN